MTITLRPYQQKVIDDLIVALRKGYKKPLIVCATGGGKTAIATKIAEGIKNKGNSLIFMCHRTELVDQTYRTFLKNDIEPDFIAAGRKFNPNSDCRIAMVNTLLRRLQKVSCPNVLIAGRFSNIYFATSVFVSKFFDFISFFLSKPEVMCLANSPTVKTSTFSKLVINSPISLW